MAVVIDLAHAAVTARAKAPGATACRKSALGRTGAFALGISLLLRSQGLTECEPTLVEEHDRGLRYQPKPLRSLAAASASAPARR